MKGRGSDELHCKLCECLHGPPARQPRAAATQSPPARQRRQECAGRGIPAQQGRKVIARSEGFQSDTPQNTFRHIIVIHAGFLAATDLADMAHRYL